MELLEVISIFMKTLMNETAVVAGTAPNQTGNSTSSGPAAAAGPITVLPTPGKRPADISASETGTGEAEAKQPRDDATMLPVPAEHGYENLG